MPTNVNAITARSTTIQSLEAVWTQVGTMNLGTANANIDQIGDLTSAQQSDQQTTIREGTFILVSMGYDVATTSGTVTAAPVLVCIGRRIGEGDDGWRVLKTRTGAISLTLVCSPGTSTGSDFKGGGGVYQYTSPDPAVDCFDRAGTTEQIWLVKTALAVSAGSAATSRLFVKPL